MVCDAMRIPTISVDPIHYSDRVAPTDRVAFLFDRRRQKWRNFVVVVVVVDVAGSLLLLLLLSRRRHRGSCDCCEMVPELCPPVRVGATKKSKSRSMPRPNWPSFVLPSGPGGWQPTGLRRTRMTTKPPPPSDGCFWMLGKNNCQQDSRRAATETRQCFRQTKTKSSTI